MMEEGLKHIDNDFRTRLGAYEEAPDRDVWDNIARRLGHKRRQQGMLFVFRIAAGITLLVGISLFMQNQGVKPVQEQLSLLETETQLEEPINAHALPIATSSKIPEADIPLSAKIPVGEKKITTANSRINAENSQPILNNIISGAIPTENDEELYLITEDYQATEVEDIIAIRSEESIPLTSPDPEPPVMQPMDAKTTVAFLNNTEPNEENEEERIRKRWGIGGHLGPNYAYRTLVSDFMKKEQVKKANALDNALITYSGGLHVTFNAMKRLSVQGGVVYSKIGQEKTGVVEILASESLLQGGSGYRGLVPGGGDGKDYQRTPSQTKVQVVNATGSYAGTTNSGKSGMEFNSIDNQNELLANNVLNISSTENLHSILEYFEYVEIPLQLRYKVINRKLEVSLISGASANVLVGTALFSNYDDRTEYNGQIGMIQKFNYGGAIALGFEYPVAQNLVISLEPRFKYYLTPINTHTLYNIHPYTFGLMTGASYRF